MACEQCLHDDEEILAIRRNLSEKNSDTYDYHEEDLPSDDCDRGKCAQLNDRLIFACANTANTLYPT